MRILMVENNPDDVRLLREHLMVGDRSAEAFQVVHVDRLVPAMDALDTS